MPSATNDIDKKLQELLHESLTRVCVDAQLDRLRLVPRPFDAAAHTELYASLTGTYAAHLGAMQATFLTFAASANAVAPINQLPPDVLVEILAWLPNYARVRASHVCSYWRSTALESATLWSAIDTTVTRKANPLVELLRRTKNAPVSVKALDIFMDGDDADEVEEVSFDGLEVNVPPGPLLGTLVIRADDWTDRIEVKFSDAPGAFASLQRLHLGATPMSTFKHWPDLPSLVDLRFQWCGLGTGSSSPFDLLERALQQSPALAQLVISDIPYPDLDDPMRAIELPNLQHLGIAGNVETPEPMGVLLKFFSSPKVPHVSLYGFSLDDFSQPLRFVIEEDTPNVVEAYVSRYSTSPEIQYGAKFSGIDGEKPYSLRTVDDRGFSRTLYCLPNPREVIGEYSTTLRRLFMDVHSWRYLMGDATTALEALEDLTIFGYPFFLTFDDAIVGPLLLPSLKNLTIYIGTQLHGGLMPEDWDAEIVEAFLNLHIGGYQSPLDTLRLYGGFLDVDDEGRELELQETSLAAARSALQDRARVLDIGIGEISTAEFNRMESWIPDPPWARSPTRRAEL
ncbi:hypothetical protein EXIGLDRAFT_704154 [Exidia glandulosa HHB12029]|uniref:F-box domain-containing protein n=1 Tax=Exidia glandulosa HHB12029 TaxID=1314781 RepID=A0A165KYZ8_EXIGL|nr:hypothetical protein EXIGLDRAFT_704154 [Exidia glandulosa HHB12029]